MNKIIWLVYAIILLSISAACIPNSFNNNVWKVPGMQVKIDDVNVTNVTSNNATISWKTDKTAECWLDFNYPNCGKCIGKTKPNTNHELILDNYLLPNTTYTFQIEASYVLKEPGEHNDGIYIYTISEVYSFTTLPDNGMKP